MNSPEPALGSQWALSWASYNAQEEPVAVEAIRSNGVNEAFRLRFTCRSLFLKVGPALEREYVRLQWLYGKLPAPEPISFKSQNGIDAILVSCVEGRDLADLSASLSPQAVVTRLVAALQAIHALDTASWPFGGAGVLVHGDACLPNFLYSGDSLSAYIDVGDLALGDPETDLSAAIWSLQYNLGPGHGLAFLHEYGVTDADENMVERLRLLYECW